MNFNSKAASVMTVALILISNTQAWAEPSDTEPAEALTGQSLILEAPIDVPAPAVGITVSEQGGVQLLIPGEGTGGTGYGCTIEFTNNPGVPSTHTREIPKGSVLKLGKVRYSGCSTSRGVANFCKLDLEVKNYPVRMQCDNPLGYKAIFYNSTFTVGVAERILYATLKAKVRTVPPIIIHPTDASFTPSDLKINSLLSPASSSSESAAVQSFRNEKNKAVYMETSQDSEQLSLPNFRTGAQSVN